MIITEDPARAAQVSRTELGCIDLDYLLSLGFHPVEITAVGLRFIAEAMFRLAVRGFRPRVAPPAPRRMPAPHACAAAPAQTASRPYPCRPRRRGPSRFRHRPRVAAHGARRTRRRSARPAAHPRKAAEGSETAQTAQGTRMRGCDFGFFARTLSFQQKRKGSRALPKKRRFFSETAKNAEAC